MYIYTYTYIDVFTYTYIYIHMYANTARHQPGGMSRCSLLASSYDACTLQPSFTTPLAAQSMLSTVASAFAVSAGVAVVGGSGDGGKQGEVSSAGSQRRSFCMCWVWCRDASTLLVGLDVERSRVKTASCSLCIDVSHSVISIFTYR